MTQDIEAFRKREQAEFNRRNVRFNEMGTAPGTTILVWDLASADDTVDTVLARHDSVWVEDHPRHGYVVIGGFSTLVDGKRSPSRKGWMSDTHRIYLSSPTSRRRLNEL